MGQTLSSLEYDNCSELCTNADLVFSKSQLKVNFEKTNPVLPIEKFPFLLLARDTMMLQHLIIHFMLHYLSNGRLREVKYKGKIQTMSSKNGRCRRREVVAYKRFQI